MALSRRDVIAASTLLVGARAGSVFARAVCSSPLSPTLPIAGPPEYIPGAPLRTSLLDEKATGQRIRIVGRALTTRCEPLRGAHLEFWHTNAVGLYDMAGFAFRGAQLTDDRGRFRLDTVMPGQYNGPRHVHFLLAKRIGRLPQPLMLSAAIYFPTRQEFAHPWSARYAVAAEFLNPAALQTIDGVLEARCDIVLEGVT